MNQWHFYEPVYRRWVVLVIGSHDDFIQFMRDTGYKHMKDVEQEAQGMCIRVGHEDNTEGNNASVVWLAKWDLSILVHEIMHLVIDTFDNLGVPVSLDNTEGVAFYSEYWYTTMTKARREHKNGITPQQAKGIVKSSSLKKQSMRGTS